MKWKYQQNGNTFEHEVRPLSEAECKQLLETLPEIQRNPRKEAVNRYANAMKKGQWRYMADPIRLCRDGTLVDGQHRVLAMLKAKKFPPVMVVSGYDALKDYPDIDGSCPRTIGDAFKAHGVTDCNVKAGATLRLHSLLCASWDCPPRNNSPSRKELLKIYDREKMVIERWVFPCKAAGAFIGAKSHLVGIVSYAQIQGVDGAEIEKALDALETGLGGNDHPMVALRRQIAADNNRSPRHYNHRQRMKMSIKAFRLTFAGKRVKRIVLKKEEGFQPIEPAVATA